MVDDDNYQLFAGMTWAINNIGKFLYASTLNNLGKKIFMHRIIMGNPDSRVYHMDENGLNNVRSNLRVATSRSMVKKMIGKKHPVKIVEPKYFKS